MMVFVEPSSEGQASDRWPFTINCSVGERDRRVHAETKTAGRPD